MNISLIGMMGSGKTTVGGLLASRTGRGFIDVDLLIEEEKKMTIAEIFSGPGEEEFRKFEKEAVDKLSERDNLVISTGGGLAANEENMCSLKKLGPVIWLYASPEETLRRVSGTEKRPLLNVEDPEKKIKSILSARESCYGRADFKIDTTEKTPEQITDEILTFLGDYSHGGCKP